MSNKPKILFLDIETAPALAYVWRIFKEYIPLTRLMESGYMLCWAGKWRNHAEPSGSRGPFCYSLESNPIDMVEEAHRALTEADIVVHYNGARFDVPTLNREMASLMLSPPAPYKQVDLYKVVKKHFKLESYKMEYVLKYFGLPEKKDNGGFETWLGAIEGEESSWKKLIKYNKADVTCTEALYDFLLPWIDNHPNSAFYSNKATRPVCTNCGSGHLQSRGTYPTAGGRYRRFQCVDCGTWCRERHTSLSTKEGKTVLTSARL